MGRRGGNFWRCYALAMLCCVLSAIPAQGANPANETALTIVTIDSSDEDLIQSVATRLGATMRDNGGLQPETIIVSSRSELTDLIEKGVADVVISDVRATVSAMTQNPMATAVKVVGSRKDLAPVVFVVKKNSTIQTLDDLRGQSLAFEGLTNRSGYFAPITHLMRADFEMRYLASVRDAPMLDVINFVFAGDEVNMVAWLDRGLVDAIAFNRSDWDNDEETPPHIRETLRIILDEDVPMDHYVTLVSRDALRQSDVIRSGFLNDPARPALFTSLSQAENAQLDYLIETAAKAAGNYLANE